MSRTVFVSAHGNVFMHEIADHLVEAMRARGDDAQVVTDELPRPAGPGVDPLEQLVLAPHEFFTLFPADEADRLAAATGAVCIGTEQPGTPFFDLALHYARRGPLMFDINAYALDAVRGAGLRAVHLPLGVTASMDCWGGDVDRPRSIDIGLMAGRTQRRERFVAGAAAQLWEWSCDLQIFSWHRPIARHRAPEVGFLVGAEKYARLAETRILLNVHRSDEPYFEWARVLEAVANGCVVATETSLDIAPFVPGEHLVMAPYEVLAEEAVALAFDEPRRRRMAAAAAEVAQAALDQGDLVEGALRAARVMLDSTPPPPPVAVQRATEAVQRARRAAVAFGARAGGYARRVVTTPPPPEPLAEIGVLDATAADLKRSALAQLRHLRRLEGALATMRHGDPDHLDVRTTPAYDEALARGRAPRVSVVVPLFDQGRFLGDAVSSVVGAAREMEVELIIVDDHSTDDSLADAHRLLENHPWFPMIVLARAANGGLPVARNTGFARARAPYVFALDADNAVYPNAFRALADRLDRCTPEVVATYGLLERFDGTGSLGLLSHLRWDVDLLVQGAYIDAMAMWRSTAWRELGGYASADAIHGWEDYDLWLSAAERGWRAELVTTVVGRYREHAGSMRGLSDIDMASNFVVLRERHPRLPWPS